ncbi:hypothetical protein [Thiolapillus sp.]|uniref:hypothetical protein n=1 Tax=Thiolapillus sp. TaxID=2017437 RepID=UPI003AF760BF
MPTFINKLPGGLSIDGANGHTYHIDGSQSIEITDDDVAAMREMGAFKLLEEQGSVVIEGAAEPKEKDDEQPGAEPDAETEVSSRRRGRPKKSQENAD